MSASQTTTTIQVTKIFEIPSQKTKILKYFKILALHHAVLRRKLEIVELLLAHPRLDPKIRSHEGCTALFVGIVANCPIEILEPVIKACPILVAIKNNEEVPPLHEAVRLRRLDLVKLLIEHGANVNDFDLDLENCLHLAASNTDYNMIEFFLNETEADPRAKNRDEMDPLCLLLVRSRDEDVDLVTRCFHIMLEESYDKSLITGTYEIKDLFKCAFLACVYSQMEVLKFIIHNVYSVQNSKYELIQKLCEHCDGENTEYLFYILVFLHDDITRYDKYQFPRFSEINYYMAIRSVVQMMEKLLPTENAVNYIIQVLQHMEKIDFNIRVREFEDQMGVLLHGLYSETVVNDEDLEKIGQIFAYLKFNNFRVDYMVRSYLHSIAIAKESEAFVMESIMRVFQVLIRYATTFFVNFDVWRAISDFKNLNPRTNEIVTWIVRSFGNAQLAMMININVLFPLKHLARNQIRHLMSHDGAVLCNRDQLAKTGLPDTLLDYVVFKE